MRVPWARYGGDDIEHVIAMMLCRRFRNSLRIRPSRGDGGVDILVPAETGVEVWQVKKFATNLSSSQKAQIKESINRLRDFITERGLPVVEWHLIMPLEPTHENREWLDAQLTDVDFNHFWHGLEYVDELASAYPEVIDYYLRDGKDRLKAALEDLVAAMNLQGATAPLTAADATSGLEGIFRSINALDPHYRYEFDVSEELREPPLGPDLVFATIRSHRGVHVTYRVYQRCAESTVERPVKIALAIPLQQNPELTPDIEAFTKYGTGFTTPAVAEINADLPGGLGGKLSQAIVRLGDNGSGDHYLRRFQVIAPDRKIIAETKVNMRHASTGLDGTGIRTIGEEVNDVFTCEILADLTGKSMNFKLLPKDISGRLVVDIAPGIRLLDQIGAPNRLRICLPAGPPNIDPLPQMFPINANPASRQLVEDLLTIQEHTPTQIMVPQAPDVTVKLLRKLDEIARLLRGEEVVTKLTSMTLHMDVSNPELAEGPQQLVLDQELAVTLGGERIQLGRYRTVVPVADLRIERGETCGKVYLMPLTGHSLESRKMLLPNPS